MTFKNAYKRIISFMLCLILMLSIPILLPDKTIAPVKAAPSVSIVGFISGNTTGLRSSELLQAKVEGYDGHVGDLTYKWTNNLGSTQRVWFSNRDYTTYLYVYNSHNMYAVQGTSGEQEIYNPDKGGSALGNMDERSHSKSFSGVGYSYAAVYGANLNSNGYDYAYGNVTVEVYDGDTLIGTASYSGFRKPSLAADLDAAVFGVFEGETIPVKDLLGESAIVHVNCTECTISNAKIVSGANVISIGGSAPEYTATGLTKGVAQINITVEKDNCKFHQYSSYTAAPMVHVFKKPLVSGDLHSLTLTNLDPDCTYYINHVQGVRSDDGQTLVFDGLEHSTTYEIEVHGHYTDDGEDKVAYAFVYGTTLTPNIAAVYLRLDNEIVTTDAVGLSNLHLRDANGVQYPLQYNAEAGVYYAEVLSGVYHVYNEMGQAVAPAQEIVINGVDAATTIHYYTVTYDANGGTLENTPSPQIYRAGTTITATSEIPHKDRHYFKGWIYNDNLYSANSVVNIAINEPMVLTAQWGEAIDVWVNITIDHYSAEGEGPNNDQAKHDIAFTIDGRPQGQTGDYNEFAHTSIDWDGTSVFYAPGYVASYTHNQSTDTTQYSATAPTFTDIPSDDSMEYTITTHKSQYYIKEITHSFAENGDAILHVVLQFNPSNFDLYYEVELDEEAKKLPSEMKPIAANIKVLAWHDSYHDDSEEPHWHTFINMTDTYEQITLDENGFGSGTYPVWIETTDGFNYHYRIEVISFVLPDGSIVAAENVDGAHQQYKTADERFIATMDVTGKDPNLNNDNPLTGAYYEDETDDGVDNPTQRGDIKAWISIKKPTLTLDAWGGTIPYVDGEQAVLPDILVVPDITDYTPVREGYKFGGYYTFDDVLITEGLPLTADTTGWAHWIPLQKIEGTVTADYTYQMNGVTIAIPEKDRYDHTEVLLRRRPKDTLTYATVAEQVIYFDTTKTLTATDFVFEDIPTTSDKGVEYEYIIAVRQANVTVEYTPDYTYTAYDVSGNEEIRHAAYPVFTDGVGEAQAYLSFAPDEFVLPFEVDTTLIAEPSVRPIAVTVVYEAASADTATPLWTVISQHEGEGHQLKANVVDGFAEGSFPVWKTTPDSHAEYLYRLKVIDYTMPDGTVVAVANDHLFNIYYGNPVSSATPNPVITARFSPLPLEIMLDTDLPDAALLHPDYTDIGASEKTEGDLYAGQFFYGKGLASLPTPEKAEYSFVGWFDDNGTQVSSIPADTTEDVYLTAHWESGFTVTFLSNNRHADTQVFRTYYQPHITLPDGDKYKHLDEKSQIASFYDIPVLDYNENNSFIFKGWYLDEDNDNDSRPLDWNATFTEETNVYAHWIYVDTVEKEEDGKQTAFDQYNSYDLLGVQIRSVDKDRDEHHGEAASGLRFITVLSENVLSDVQAIHTANASATEYGFVVAKTATSETYKANSTDPDNYQLHYKSSNVNGVDTRTDYSYVANVKGSGVADHFNGKNYRLYTAVVTFKNKEGDALAEAQAQYLLARPYMRYYDANGLYRTYYNNYTGTAVHHACSASYTNVYTLLGTK